MIPKMDLEDGERGAIFMISILCSCAKTQVSDPEPYGPLVLFSIENPIIKQWITWSDATFCGASSEFLLFEIFPKIVH